MHDASSAWDRATSAAIRFGVALRAASDPQLAAVAREIDKLRNENRRLIACLDAKPERAEE